MIDHFSLPVTDFDRSRAFYDAVLATLGYRPLETEDLDEYVACGYGVNAGEPPFWIGAGKGPDEPPVPQPGQHIAFRAPDRAAVDAFHRAGDGHRRYGQRRAGAASALPPELLRGVRHRPGRLSRRSRLPCPMTSAP